MRVLITGAAGFAGRHLAEFASRQPGVKLFALSRRDGDVRDCRQMEKVLRKARPERIFHLAGFASVSRSWEDPSAAFQNNIGGTRALMDAASRCCPKARILVTSTAEVYGSASGKRPFTEDSPLKPMNPYAVSKIAQEFAAYQYFLTHGLHVVRTRAFNHLGPGQADAYVSASFAKQVARIESRRQTPVVLVGNLGAVRDFTDVRDVVRAYWLCLEKGAAGEVYNVASGRGRRIGEMLEYYLSLSAVTIKTQKDRRRLRAADPSVLVGDAGKLRRRTGWKPVFSFEETLSDVLDEWRGKE